MAKRLALLTLLAGALVACPGPQDHVAAAFGGKTTQVTSGRVQDLLPSWRPL
jgi:hypothetical protein